MVNTKWKSTNHNAIWQASDIPSRAADAVVGAMKNLINLMIVTTE